MDFLINTVILRAFQQELNLIPKLIFISYIIETYLTLVLPKPLHPVIRAV